MTPEARSEQIREFILDNYSVASTWEPHIAEDWAAWAAYNGFLHLCYDSPENQKLVGLTIARPLSISRLNDKEIEDTAFDEDGEVLYVDLAISTAGKSALQAMMHSIKLKAGNRQLIVFKRLKTKDKIKVYQFRDLAEKLTR